MSDFNNKKFEILRSVISSDLAEFVYKYFLLKRDVSRTLFKTKFISPFTDYFGQWGDDQVPKTYAHYSDIAMETLLLKVKPIIEKTDSFSDFNKKRGRG